MKKNFKVFLILVLLISILSACGDKKDDYDKESITIVTTIFPEYDWMRNICKGNEKIKIKLLLDDGIDLHNFQPTVDDIVTINESDVFVYVGGESDEWVDEVLENKSNNKVIINLMDNLKEYVKEEETIEGMQEEADEEEEESEYDEHIWLSLNNAIKICEVFKNELIKIDSDNKKLYEDNANNYINELKKLDEKYRNIIKEADKNVLLFGDRFPFRYLVEDYNLDYYAAFKGCSAETEASFSTITFLANKVDELKLNSIIIIDGSNKKIAETIRSNTISKDQKILVLNSIQSNIKDETYLSIMEENLLILQEALD